MFTTRPERASDASQPGFTALELLIGLSLTVCLALAVAPLWLSLQRCGVRDADRAITLLQGRVAVARFERDLRLAGAGGCRFAVTGPILEASPSQVVFLSHSQPGVPLALVEWEVANGCVMRRWGVCPETRPVVYSHFLYDDNKTMLEGIEFGSSFAYVVDGCVLEGSIPFPVLPSVEAVILDLAGSDEGGTWPGAVRTKARVAR